MKTPSHLRFLTSIFIAGSAPLALDSCGGHLETKHKDPLSAVTVETVTVEHIPHAATEDVIGTVRPKLCARVEAKLSSRIEQVFVAPGQAVTQGATLALLDAREVQARLEQAHAVLSQADKDFQRLQPLLRSKAISRQDFDAADAKLRVAKSAAAEAETMLTYTTITAPFDGIITRKLADVGDLAMPGKPLFEIESPATLRFEAAVPEALVNQVQFRQTLSVSLNGFAEPITGNVVEIAPMADPVSRTFLTKLDLPQAPGIRAGQFGRMQVTVGESDVPLVPAAAVVQRGQMELVRVVKSGRASMRIVSTGKLLAEQVEIRSGLDAGETVILGDSATVQDGQRVEVKP
jgi:RND family efflux transporter MFP subunit